jgi:hypothetical protein
MVKYSSSQELKLIRLLTQIINAVIQEKISQLLTLQVLFYLLEEVKLCQLKAAILKTLVLKHLNPCLAKQAAVSLNVQPQTTTN